MPQDENKLLLSCTVNGTFIGPCNNLPGMACRPRLSDPVCNALDEIAKEYKLPNESKAQAVRKAVREMGYDV